jgi:signal transduction histidine kinase
VPSVARPRSAGRSWREAPDQRKPGKGMQTIDMPSLRGLESAIAGRDLMRNALWAGRAIALVFAVGATFQASTQHRPLVIAGLAVTTVLLLAWGAIVLAPQLRWCPPGWLLPVVLSAMAAVGGLLTGVHGAQAFVAFPFLAAVGAGSDLGLGPVCAVAATGILAIEASALIFSFQAQTALVWPFLIVVGLLVGRWHRDAGIQRAQGQALAALAEQTRAEQQRAATLDERARMAREIHDLLAHTLGALGIQLETTHAILTDTADVERAAQLVEDARRLAGTGLAETRRAIEVLRSNTPPLPESLAGLAESHERQHRSPVSFTVTGDPRPLAPDATLALVRTAGEALVNAGKHAPAATLTFTLDYGPQQITMTVCNDLPEPLTMSRPSESQDGRNGGYGLAGMRERLLLIGGTLTAGPAGNRWTVQAKVPA